MEICEELRYNFDVGLTGESEFDEVNNAKPLLRKQRDRKESKAGIKLLSMLMDGQKRIDGKEI